MNIAHNLERAARHFPNKPAILFEGGELSYRQLEEAVNRVAGGLATLGVEMGDRIALFLPNIPAFPIAYLAAQKLGAVVVSVNVMLTTGELDTTGRQKGAVLSHGNVVSNLFTVNRYLRMAPADRILITTPLFHVAAQNVMMNSGLNVAATLVLHRRFDVQRCAAAIEEHKITLMMGVPTIYIALLDARVGPEALSSVRLFKSAAATMPVEIARRWQETYGKTVYEGYGLTETSPAATFNHEYEYRLGSVGTPVEMVEMRVVDAEDREVPPGTWGEVVFRGPNVMLGYWTARPRPPRRCATAGSTRVTSVTWMKTATSTWSIASRI